LLVTLNRKEREWVRRERDQGGLGKERRENGERKRNHLINYLQEIQT
jgi:hypothetical protein